MGTRIPFLGGLLFLSGAGTLVLEVAWFRRTAQVAGATSVAMGAVLAAVIGGMAAGSFLFGRIADRSARPLRLYGWLEAGVAASAVVTPWLLDASRGAFDLLFRAFGDSPVLLAATRFLLASLLLAGPAILMGGTLPAMACALRVAPEGRGRALGLLYAANTLGAVAGTFAAGFVLVPALGLAGATRSAAFLSGAAAAGALLARAGRERAAPAPAAPPAAGARRAVLLYAASGFLGLAAEVAFTRQLVLVFGSTTYAFTTMLGVFLLGIGLGGAAGALLARRPDRLLPRLETTVAATAAVFALSSLLVYLLPRLYLVGVATFADTFREGLFLRFLLSLVVLLPGAIGLGIAFPLAAGLAAAGAAGDGTGRLYAANTLASITGSTLAVFLLVPVLGPGRTIVLVAIAVAVLAAWRRRPLPVALAAVALVGLWPPSPVAREHLLAGVFFQANAFVDGDRLSEEVWAEGQDVPWSAWGSEAAVAILRWYGTAGVTIDGKAVATNKDFGDVHHLSLLGHLPMALHPDPRRVVVVGLGMGITYSACRQHGPDVLRVVELEPAVAGAAAYLGARPEDLVVADARAWLRATDETFDVITSDPIHPWVRGGGDLYTLEYFEACRARLAPGGVACQWLPVYQMGVDDLRAVVRTFAAVFGSTSVFYGGGDLVLVGRADGPLPEPRRLGGEAGEALDALGLGDLAKLRVADRARLLEDAGEGPLLRDDSLRLEFSAPRYADNHALADAFAWVRGLWAAPPPPFGRILAAQKLEAEGDYRGIWPILRKAAAENPGDRYVIRHTAQQYLFEAEDSIFGGELRRASFALERAAELMPGDPRLLGIEADLRIEQGRREEARALLGRLLDLTPDSTYLRRRIAALER